ncbi:MAG: purine-nucleoside phosphorylase [Candidatus Marinimicrobia bacterium]|nr:purine-nucleoside phosphorylase [Candidatus Neomarinimicrobiota bacterium]
MKKNNNISTEKIKSQFINFDIEIGIVLGSGLSSFAENLEEIVEEIPYSQIENFPQTTVVGHDGKFIIGKLKGKTILIASGRFHYYEGYGKDEVISIVKFFKEFGIKNVIISNAAGIINTNFVIGDIVLIEDCIDFTKTAGNYGNISKAKIGKVEKEKVKLVENKIDFKLQKGKYVWSTGPTYETASEIQYMKQVGGDMVGMSTMPEIIWARENGMSVFPFSCGTNFGTGISKEKLDHSEVKINAEKVKDKFRDLIIELIDIL